MRGPVARGVLAVAVLVASPLARGFDLAAHHLDEPLLEAYTALNRLTVLTNDVYGAQDGARARLPVVRDNYYYSRDRIIKIRRALDSMVGHDRIESLRDGVHKRIEKEMDDIRQKLRHEISENWEEIRFAGTVNQRAWVFAYSGLGIAALCLLVYACNLGRRISAVCTSQRSTFAYL